MLSSRIAARAKVWAGQITKEAHKNLGKFRSLITVKSNVQSDGDKVGIVSTATSPKDVARAYEYGSGVHSRVKRRSKRQQADGRILILPKNKKVLAFFWDKVSPETPAGKKFRGISPDTGKAIFNYVEHPGVRAANNGKGYLVPAITKVRRQIRKEIPKEVREEVFGTIRKAFKK